MFLWGKKIHYESRTEATIKKIKWSQITSLKINIPSLQWLGHSSLTFEFVQSEISQSSSSFWQFEFSAWKKKLIWSILYSIFWLMYHLFGYFTIQYLPLWCIKAPDEAPIKAKISNALSILLAIMRELFQTLSPVSILSLRLTSRLSCYYWQVYLQTKLFSTVSS